MSSTPLVCCFRVSLFVTTVISTVSPSTTAGRRHLTSTGGRPTPSCLSERDLVSLVSPCPDAFYRRTVMLSTQNMFYKQTEISPGLRVSAFGSCRQLDELCTVGHELSVESIAPQSQIGYPYCFANGSTEPCFTDIWWMSLTYRSVHDEIESLNEHNALSSFHSRIVSYLSLFSLVGLSHHRMVGDLLVETRLICGAGGDLWIHPRVSLEYDYGPEAQLSFKTLKCCLKGLKPNHKVFLFTSVASCLMGWIISYVI